MARPVLWREQRRRAPLFGSRARRTPLGGSGLLALSLVAATSAHAWRSGPAVPTAVAAASARVAWTCAAVRVSVHSGS